MAVRSIVVDTLTGIMDELYMTDSIKPTHDIWKDWAQTTWGFCSALQDMGFELILVVGDPGTGKTLGIRTLPEKTNILYNSDNKNLLWKGASLVYGTKAAPKKPWHQIPFSYDEILDNVQSVLDKGKFEERRFAFLTGHVETYKKSGVDHSRLHVIGRVANKMFMERKFEHVFYSKVIIGDNGPEYILETQNDGTNTARSAMDLFEPRIPNDYQLIVDKLLTL